MRQFRLTKLYFVGSTWYTIIQKQQIRAEEDFCDVSPACGDAPIPTHKFIISQKPSEKISPDTGADRAHVEVVRGGQDGHNDEVGVVWAKWE